MEKNSHTVIQSVEHWKGANGNLIKIIDTKNQDTLLAPGLAEGRLTEDPTATLVTPKPKKARPQGLRLESRELREVFSRLDLESPFGIRDRAVLGMLVETGVSAGACSRIDVVQRNIGNSMSHLWA
ncbi:MAG: hypothetical protein WC314_25705 [Vulcanimicrobiota bacterium]